MGGLYPTNGPVRRAGRAAVGFQEAQSGHESFQDAVAKGLGGLGFLALEGDPRRWIPIYFPPVDEYDYRFGVGDPDPGKYRPLGPIHPSMVPEHLRKPPPPPTKPKGLRPSGRDLWLLLLWMAAEQLARRIGPVRDTFGDPVGWTQILDCGLRREVWEAFSAGPGECYVTHAGPLLPLSLTPNAMTAFEYDPLGVFRYAAASFSRPSGDLDYLPQRWVNGSPGEDMGPQWANVAPTQRRMVRTRDRLWSRLIPPTHETGPGPAPRPRVDPPERPEPPGPGVKERKFIMAPRGPIRHVFHFVTESSQFIECMFYSMPKEIVNKALSDWYKAHPGWPLNAYEMMKIIYRHFDKVDIALALACWSQSQAHDRMIGRLARMRRKFIITCTSDTIRQCGWIRSWR